MFSTSSDVARLGQSRGVRDGERDVEQFGQGLREQRLTGAGRAEQQDVRLGKLDPVVPRVSGLDSLVVVVDRDGQRLLGLLLPDHIAVEELVDLPGLGQAVPLEVRALRELLLDDLVAEIDALVADVHTRARDELLDLLL